MKIGIAAVLAFLALPLPAAAATWWLIIGGNRMGGIAIEKVPTTSEEECEEAGKKLQALYPPLQRHPKPYYYFMSYTCVKGK